MKNRQGRVSLLLLAAASALIALAARCERSNSLTGPNGSGGAITITTIWSGTFTSALFGSGCSLISPARATLMQNGSRVTGRLDAPDNPCGFHNVAFEGTRNGKELVGTIAGDRFIDGTAHGILLSDSVPDDSLKIDVVNGVGGIPGGTMTLEKQLP